MACNASVSLTEKGVKRHSNTIHKKHVMGLLFCSYIITIIICLCLDIMKEGNWCFSLSLSQTWRCDVFGCYSWSLHPYPICGKLSSLAWYTCFACKWLLGWLLGINWSYCYSWWQMKYRPRVLGLILVSPLCKEPSWTEWLYNKVLFLNLFTLC